MKQHLWHNFWIRLTGLACLSGILYSSWPLGYLLNPAASKQGLASALEAVHQPYNWVFISGDVISSLIIILICWLIWQHVSPKKHTVYLKIVLINLLIFAVGTIADTLLPEQCLPGAQNCPNWQHSPLLLTHGIFSILASICLFLALLFIWWRHRTIVLYGLLAGYTIFGLLSLYEAVYPNHGNFSQHYYITLCSLWIALVPFTLQRSLEFGSSKKSID